MRFRYRQRLILTRAVWLLASVLNTTICLAEDYQAIHGRAIQLFPQNGNDVTETIQQADESGVAAGDVTLILSRSAEAGLSAASFVRLMAPVIEARKAALPSGPFTEKIMEGFAKEVDPSIVIEVLDKKLQTYREAKKLVVDTTQQQFNDNAVSSVALAIERGVSLQGLRRLFSADGCDPATMTHAAQSLADFESMGFTEDEGIEIAQAGLRAGYLSTSASSLTLVVARAQKLGLSNRKITETMTSGLNQGLPLAAISLELHGGGPQGMSDGQMPGGRMRGDRMPGGRNGQGHGAPQGSGSHGNGPGGRWRSN